MLAIDSIGEDFSNSAIAPNFETAEFLINVGGQP